MEPLNTTTMGEGEFVATESPFHSMNAVERISAILRTCERIWRGLRRLSSDRPRRSSKDIFCGIFVGSLLGLEELLARLRELSGGVFVEVEMLKGVGIGRKLGINMQVTLWRQLRSHAKVNLNDTSEISN